MRATIRQKLIADLSIDIGERVYEPQAVGVNMQKPFLVLRQGVDVDDSPWTGFRRIIEVWPYSESHSQTFQELDSLIDKIVLSLDQQLLTTPLGEVFTCQYLGTIGTDIVDVEWGAITRGLRFAILALQPTSVPETVANDAWIEALSAWTETILGVVWTVYRNRWPAGYVRPAVLWRLNNFSVSPELGRSGSRVSKKITGHVLGSTPNEEIQSMVQIVQGLSQEIKIILSLTNKKYLLVKNPSGDFQANSLEQGQITVELTRITARPEEAVPLMQKVDSTGFWR